jgi:glycosyltransferase involved in cell wall biosynthesis
MIRSHLSPHIATAIENDRPDMILDMGSILWAQVLQRELAGHYPFAEVIHDSTPHPGVRYPIYVAQRIIYPSMADILVGMSEYCTSQLARKYPGKVHITSRHGVILGQQDIDPKHVAQQRSRFLFFGQITQYKGLDVLVDAYAEAKKHNCELNLTICGRGLIKPHLRAKIAGLKIDLTNDYIPDEQVAALMKSHGVLMLPYNSATQSGVAAAALANGLPAIATNVGALPEQVINGKNGIIVPPRNPQMLAEAMLKIASDKSTAMAMSAQAISLARDQFSWDTIGAKLLSDLEMALKSARRMH